MTPWLNFNATCLIQVLTPASVLFTHVYYFKRKSQGFVTSISVLSIFLSSADTNLNWQAGLAAALYFTQSSGSLVFSGDIQTKNRETSRVGRAQVQPTVEHLIIIIKKTVIEQQTYQSVHHISSLTYQSRKN